MLKLEVLIIKPVAIDGLASVSSTLCKVSSLSHEVRNDSVEMAVLVVKWNATVTDTSFSGRERFEVFDSLRHYVAEQAKDDAPSWLLVNLDVKVYLVGNFGERLI